MAQLTKFLHGGGREFFDLFERAGTNIVEAAALLDRMLHEFPDSADLAHDIRACEQRGDLIVHEVIARLNQTGGRWGDDGTNSSGCEGACVIERTIRLRRPTRASAPLESSTWPAALWSSPHA